MMSFTHIAETAPAMKVALVAGGSMAFTAISSAVMFIAQLDGSGESTVTTVSTAGALTAAVGGLVYIVRLIVSGKLVHRDPEEANQKLQATIAGNTAALHLVLRELKLHDLDGSQR